jgi:hypothetical protein
MIRKRQFTKESIDEFNYLSEKGSCQESLSSSDVNSSFDAFMGMTFYHYDTAFLLKTAYRSNKNK